MVIAVTAVALPAGCGVASGGAAPSPLTEAAPGTAAAQAPIPAVHADLGQVVRIAAINLYGRYTLAATPVSLRAEGDGAGGVRVGLLVEARCAAGSCLLGRAAFRLTSAATSAPRCVEDCYEPAFPAEAELDVDGTARGFLTWRVPVGRYRLTYALDGVAQPVATVTVAP